MQNAVEKDGKSAVLNKSTVVTRSALQDQVNLFIASPFYKFSDTGDDTAAERARSSIQFRTAVLTYRTYRTSGCASDLARVL